jgi:hypothetical protein
MKNAREFHGEQLIRPHSKWTQKRRNHPSHSIAPSFQRQYDINDSDGHTSVTSQKSTSWPVVLGEQNSQGDLRNQCAGENRTAPTHWRQK